MKHRFFLLVTGIGLTMAAASLVLFLVEPPQLTQADLPDAEITPTSTPTPRPTATPATVWRPSGPRNLIKPPPDYSTPVFRAPIDLNLDRHRYVELHMRPDHEDAVFRLRCVPPVPPRPPYPGVLEGCPAGGAGIIHLDEIVEAGIMTRQEVNDTIAGSVVQQWR